MDVSQYQLSISQFDYPLTEDRIARYPLPRRDMSRLLLYGRGQVSETVFNKLPGLLQPSDLLVFNNTKVVRARMVFGKETGARIEIFCLEPVDPADYAEAFQQQGSAVWKCIVGNKRKWKQGKLCRTIDGITLQAELAADFTTFQHVRFTWDDGHSWGEVMDALGFTPIPPYLNRESEPIDEQRYQTVYSKFKGSVAAPTAGLHFTPELLETIAARGIASAEVTLHVGAGTFKPVTASLVRDHEMHAEFFVVDRETLRALQTRKGRIVAVGTTSVRTLESLYWMGVKLLTQPQTARTMPQLELQQFEAYSLPQDVPFEVSMQALADAVDGCGSGYVAGHTGIMIMPGYRFQVVDVLITNFHQPKSTLLLLVSAFIGDDWRKVYDYALEHGFRFLSYGDSSMLVRG